MFLALLAIAAAIVFASTKVSRMTKAIDDLTAQVHQATTVAAGAVALITGLAAKLRDNADDPDAIEALASQLEQSTAALSTAVVANTDAQPVPAVPATGSTTTDTQASAGTVAEPAVDPAPSA